MTYLEMKELVISMSSNRANIDKATLLNRRIQTGINQVCRHCTPLVLTKRQGSRRAVMKHIDSTNYICIPQAVTGDDTSLIELDDILAEAVALHVLAGLETARAPSYMRMFYTVCEDYENSLVNDYISFDENTYVNNDSVGHFEDFGASKKEVDEEFNPAPTTFDILKSKYGLKDIYTSKIERITGTEYIWDEEFILLLNDFFHNGDLVVDNLSDRINLDDYIAYHTSDAETGNDMYDKLNIYLAKLNEEI